MAAILRKLENKDETLIVYVDSKNEKAYLREMKNQTAKYIRVNSNEVNVRICPDNYIVKNLEEVKSSSRCGKFIILDEKNRKLTLYNKEIVTESITESIIENETIEVDEVDVGYIYNSTKKVTKTVPKTIIKTSLKTSTKIQEVYTMRYELCGKVIPRIEESIPEWEKLQEEISREVGKRKNERDLRRAMSEPIKTKTD